MESMSEMNCGLDNPNNNKIVTKKDRIGRWTQSEAYLFETLLERYGKNWKKIHQHMKGRSLSQIRSHGQKFFAKVGSKKVEELERRAKLLEAYETLEKEKRLQEEVVSKTESYEERPSSPMIKMEEESPLTNEESPVSEEGKTPDVRPSEFIKEQNGKQSQQIKEVKEEPVSAPVSQAPATFKTMGTGFLISLINLYPDTFRAYGIDGFIDDQGFRNRNGFSFQ